MTKDELRRNYYSPDQIFRLLKEAKADISPTELKLRHGVSEATLRMWKGRYEGLTVDEIRRVRQIERKEPPHPLFRILCFSGGGVRGIYQAVYVRNLARLLPDKIGTFDLIAGTSTGAIIAAAVACGIDLGRVEQLFREEADVIFAKRRASALRRGPHYRSEPLRNALSLIFQDRALKDCKSKLLVPATALDNFGCRVFKNFPDAAPGLTDSYARIVDVLMASSAAPSYFPPITPKASDRTYVDGGVWANSPSLAAVIEAHGVFRVPFDRMCVLSVGNGKSPQGATAAKLMKLRPIDPSMIKTILEMMFETQADGGEVLTQLLVGPNRFLSINDVLKEEIQLDSAKLAVQILPGLAEARSKHDLASVCRVLEWTLPISGFSLAPLAALAARTPGYRR